jgi:hypothetical protein
MSCGFIDIGSSADCDNLPVGGTRARLILFNYDDVSSFTETDGIVTSITLYVGRLGYEFLGFRDDVGKSEEVVKPEIGMPMFKHLIGFTIYEDEQAQKNNIEQLSRGRFIAIVENKGQDAQSFEIVGKNVGLEIVPGSIRNAHENGGFFVLSLATPEEDGEYETKLPQTFGTDYEETLEIIIGLITPGDGVFDETFDETYE